MNVRSASLESNHVGENVLLQNKYIFSQSNFIALRSQLYFYHLYFINSFEDNVSAHGDKQHPFAGDIRNIIFWDEINCIFIKISPKFVPTNPTDNSSPWFRLWFGVGRTISHDLHQWRLVYWRI